VLHESVARRVLHESVARRVLHESVARRVLHESVARRVQHEPCKPRSHSCRAAGIRGVTAGTINSGLSLSPISLLSPYGLLVEEKVARVRGVGVQSRKEGWK
jgi:hypothetical protein